MRTTATLILLSLSVLSTKAIAQTTISNGDFEAWGGNVSPGPGVAAEPTGWYSNKSGSSTAMIGPQTCFQDNTVFHGGTSSVRVQNATVPIIGTVVNGNVTTGVINAPTATKTDGYIGTVNYTTSTDIRHMAFTGRPDSLVGWYQYTSGGTGEQGKVRAILHTGDYFDPETPTTYHPDPTANKIGNVLFLTPTGNTTTWTRFSMPFTYTASTTPQYIMINITSSNDQNTNFSGSKMWIDDLQAVYKPVTAVTEAMQEKDIVVYVADKVVYVNAAQDMGNQSVITLYDLAGRKVMSENLGNATTNSFNMSFLASGVYIYKISNTAFSKTGKLSIQ